MRRKEIISKEFNNKFDCVITFPNGNSIISNINYTEYNWYEELDNYNDNYIDFDMFNHIFTDSLNIKSCSLDYKIVSFINHFYKTCGNYPLYYIQGDYGIVVISKNNLQVSKRKLQKLNKFFKKNNLHYYLIYQNGKGYIWSF